MDVSALELSPATQANIKKYLPYLQEIQRKLIAIFVVFAVAAGLGFIYYQRILTFIMQLFNLEGISVVLTSPYQFIDLAVNTAIAMGLLAALPVVLYYLLDFIKPALLPHEYRLIISLVPISLILLITGFGFGAWVMNIIIDLFYKTSVDFSLGNYWDISQFFSQILFTAISLGLVFQLPIILTGLLRLRIIKRETLVTGRRYAYIISIIFAALLPPTDIISLTLLTLPLILLYELTLLFNQPHHLVARKEVN